ncbi:tyrosine-type recombinase/integrase [Xylophilus sp. Leaf220]|uniref:tyrosine-type recombinase/integrase n=1 Tax=Xylophilus sp. Leaf220 TaxID=1735686 RepID=UPI0009E78708|nr:tyrosine-type recombinase/integrase [Xylophilus sp. Leaf220]
MPGLRARQQKSGVVYYYFDAGGKPRKEIPLGSDYVLAVRKWAELTQAQASVLRVVDFLQLADRYQRDEMPLKAKSTQATQLSDLRHLREFFGKPPAPLDNIRPMHIRGLLDWKKTQPTTANRLKRLFSHMFNKAREWGYTHTENPATGVRGFELAQRGVYITDAVFKAVWEAGSEPLRDTMDLGYLTGQRPGDVLRMTTHDIVDGTLLVDQGKTGARRRIRIEGKLAELIARISNRKAKHNIHCSSLTVNLQGRPLTAAVLRKAFTVARKEAAKTNPDIQSSILEFWFYDLRAKAADDISDRAGEQAAADLLGHDDIRTTSKHYLRRGKVVKPTK